MSHGPLRAFSIIKFIGEGHNTSAENFHRREKEWLTVRCIPCAVCLEYHTQTKQMCAYEQNNRQMCAYE